MYLAGLIADDSQMTKADLRHWLAKATHQPVPLSGAATIMLDDFAASADAALAAAW